MNPIEKTPPPDRRPYQPPPTGFHGRTVYRTEPTGQVIRETLRQVGWHGLSGALYALDEDPTRHEPAGFAPVWQTVSGARVAVPDTAEGAAR